MQKPKWDRIAQTNKSVWAKDVCQHVWRRQQQQQVSWQHTFEDSLTLTKHTRTCDLSSDNSWTAWPAFPKGRTRAGRCWLVAAMALFNLEAFQVDCRLFGPPSGIYSAGPFAFNTKLRFSSSQLDPCNLQGGRMKEKGEKGEERESKVNQAVGIDGLV